MPHAGFQAGRVHRPDRQQLVLVVVVVDAGLRSERIQHGQHQPAADPGGIMHVVAVPGGHNVEPGRRAGAVVGRVVGVSGQRR